LIPVGGARRWKKGEGGRRWCKYCVHMYVNGKMIPFETIPEMGEVEWERKDEGE
jgi:hypothetical protein